MKNEREIFGLSNYELQGGIADSTRQRIEIPDGKNRRNTFLFSGAVPAAHEGMQYRPNVMLMTDEIRGEITNEFQIGDFQLIYTAIRDSNSILKAEKIFRSLGMSQQELYSSIEKKNSGVYCDYSSRRGLRFGTSAGDTYFAMSPKGVGGIAEEFMAPGINFRTDGERFVSNTAGLTFMFNTQDSTWNFEYSSHIMNHPDDPSTSLFFVGGVLVDTEIYPQLADDTWRQIHGTDWDETFATDVIHPYSLLRTYTFNS